MCREIPLPERPHFERYYRYSQLFSGPECDALIALAESKIMQPGSIGIGMGQPAQVDLQYRTVHTARVLEHEAPWAFQRLIKHTMFVNGEYRFNLAGLYEDIGIMRYDEPNENAPAGHYKWHQDFGGGKYSQRKISIVSLLSEFNDFEGCELHLHGDRGEERASLDGRGDTVFFPSWTPHCVTPLKRGRRYSLVAWVSGEAFR